MAQIASTNDKKVPYTRGTTFETSTMSSYTVKSQMIASFNAKSRMNPQTISSIKKDGEILVEGGLISRQLWYELRSTDVSKTKSHMNYETFHNVFQKFQTRLNSVLGVISSSELFELLDEDNDGFLNEDEQLLLFSLIKAKMLECSNRLLIIYEYKLFHQLMRSIRKLERYINKWQNKFRSKIYNHEIHKYKEIGLEKLEKFFEKYEQKFRDFFEYKKERINDFIHRRYVKKEDMEKKMESGTQALRFKPKKLLTDYQTQERLVALEERIEEAMNFRKELKDLEIHEAERLNHLWQEFMSNKSRKFDNKTEKLRKHLMVKLDNEENKLKIDMSKEFEVLKKKIALHENDIQRIQGLSTKKALHKGKTKGELFRLKSTLRNQNEIIQKSKKIKASLSSQLMNSTGVKGAYQTDPNTAADSIVGKNTQESFKKTLSKSSSKGASKNHTKSKSKFPKIGVPYRKKRALKKLKSMKERPDLIRFYIRHKFKDEIPVNAKLKSYQQGDDDQHSRIEKYLEAKEKKENNTLKLSSLYNDFLEEKTDQRRIFEEPKKKEISETRKYVYEILNFNPRVLTLE